MEQSWYSKSSTSIPFVPTMHLCAFGCPFGNNHNNKICLSGSVRTEPDKPTGRGCTSVLGLTEIRCPTRCLCAHTNCPGMPGVILCAWITSVQPLLCCGDSPGKPMGGSLHLPSGVHQFTGNEGWAWGWAWGCSCARESLPRAGHGRPHRDRAGAATSRLGHARSDVITTSLHRS